MLHKKTKDTGGKVCKKKAHNAFEYNQIGGFRVLFAIGCYVTWGDLEDSTNKPTRKFAKVLWVGWRIA